VLPTLPQRGRASATSPLPSPRQPPRREHPKLPPNPGKPKGLENTRQLARVRARGPPAAVPRPMAAAAAAPHPGDPETGANRSAGCHTSPPSPLPGAPAEPREQPGRGETGSDGGSESSFRPCGCGRPEGGTKAGAGGAPALAHRPPAQLGRPQPGRERRPKETGFFSFS